MLRRLMIGLTLQCLWWAAIGTGTGRVILYYSRVRSGASGLLIDGPVVGFR